MNGFFLLTHEISSEPIDTLEVSIGVLAYRLRQLHFCEIGYSLWMRLAYFASRLAVQVSKSISAVTNACFFATCSLLLIMIMSFSQIRGVSSCDAIIQYPFQYQLTDTPVPVSWYWSIL